MDVSSWGTSCTIGISKKMLLLRKAYAALLKGGALIVHEALIDDARKTNAFGLLMSLNMLIETAGGSDFTGADCRQWMKKAGFTHERRTSGRTGFHGHRYRPDAISFDTLRPHAYLTGRSAA